MLKGGMIVEVVNIFINEGLKDIVSKLMCVVVVCVDEMVK